ncbi:hypothetical protein RFI_03148, partial [Reticulomyxa filosa]
MSSTAPLVTSSTDYFVPFYLQHLSSTPPLVSWLKYSSDTEFPIENLPYGVFTLPNKKDEKESYIGVAIGDYILNLTLLQLDLNIFDVEEKESPFILKNSKSLKYLISLDKEIYKMIRIKIWYILADECIIPLEKNPIRKIIEKEENKYLILQNKVEKNMCLPIEIENCTHFGGSKYYMKNLCQFLNIKIPSQLLYMPMGYNGRASCV